MSLRYRNDDDLNEIKRQIIKRNILKYQKMIKEEQLSNPSIIKTVDIPLFDTKQELLNIPEKFETSLRIILASITQIILTFTIINPSTAKYTPMPVITDHNNLQLFQKNSLQLIENLERMLSYVNKINITPELYSKQLAKKYIDTYNILESSFNKLNFLKDRHGKYKFADPGRVLYNMAKKNPIDNPVIYKQFLQAYFIFPGNNDEFRASVPLMIGQKLQNIFELSAVLLESLKNIKKKLSEQYGAAISIAKDGASMPKQKIFIDPNSNNILKRYR